MNCRRKACSPTMQSRQQLKCQRRKEQSAQKAKRKYKKVLEFHELRKEKESKYFYRMILNATQIIPNLKTYTQTTFQFGHKGLRGPFRKAFFYRDF